MPKATTGGASNAWEPQTCKECGAQVAAGAPRCPECPSTSFGAADVPAPDAAEPFFEQLADVDEALAAANAEDAADGPQPAGDEPEPAGEPGAEEAPAEPQVPDADPEPAPAPRTPPRRA